VKTRLWLGLVPYGIQQSSQKNVMAAHRLENHDAWNTARTAYSPSKTEKQLWQTPTNVLAAAPHASPYATKKP